METLFEYLQSSPLPILVVNLHDPFSKPILLNDSFKVLTKGMGEDLLSVIHQESEGELRKWLSGGKEETMGGSTENYSSEEGKIQVAEFHALDSTELQMELKTSPNAFEKLPLVNWRRKTIPDGSNSFIILTGLLVVPPPRVPLPAYHSSHSSASSSTSSLLSYSEGGRINTRRPSIPSVARQARPIEERLRELELLTEFSMVGLARLDLQGRIIWVNDSWYMINGYDRSLPLDDWPSIIEPDDVEQLLLGWASALQNLQPVVFRFRVKSGKIILAQATPNSSDPSTVTGWISNITDVTDQVRAEEAITQLAIERVQAQHQDAAIRMADARREEAEEERRQQEMLIDVTSHELRQPISAIIQNAELTRNSLVKIKDALIDLNTMALDSSIALVIPPELGEEGLSALEDDIESLDSISACAMAQKLIADDILGLAQIQLNKYSISPVPFDLSASLRTTLKMFATEARAKDIELLSILGDSLAQLGSPMRIEADPTRLGQILINLLSNAIRFTGSSSGQRKVTLSIDMSSSPPAPGASLIPLSDGTALVDPAAPIYLYFKVADTGPGMSEEETSRIFEKFMQASPFTHCTMGGSGLGLFICRNLCELQGGKLEVVSQLGVGSTFRGYITCHYVDGMTQLSPLSSPRPHPQRLASVEQFPLPSARAFQSRLMPPLASPMNNRSLPRSPNLTGFFDSPTSPSSNSEISKPIITKKRLRILAVDDNEVNRKIVRRQLEQAGHFVETANDGQQALDLLRERGSTSWDVVIMDVQMPVLDGISATKAFRLSEVGTGNNLRIVGLTSGARDAQVKAALAAGMTCLVTKPYRLSSLLGSLEP